MISERKQNFSYEQLQGSLELLQNYLTSLLTSSFVIMFEYVSAPALYLTEFSRLLKRAAKFLWSSITRLGALCIQWFLKMTQKSPAAFSGQEYQTHSMGAAKVYQVQEVISGLPLEVEDYQGVRIFYGQSNDYKAAPDWAQKMLEMSRLSATNPYRDIAAFSMFG